MHTSIRRQDIVGERSVTEGAHRFLASLGGDQSISFSVTPRFDGSSRGKLDKVTLADMRGSAVIYLLDKADAEGALGYHETDYRGIPYGFVFTARCKELKESWTVTLSHEALELLGDAQNNLLVQSPHPKDPKKEVFRWFEMCDAVQSLTYKIGVSDYELPLYFTFGKQEDSEFEYGNCNSTP